MAINKVVYGGNVLIDITDSTAVASSVLDGYYFYGRDGVKTEGTCTFNADTSDATATASEILTGSSAYVNGNKVNGAMVNNGAVDAYISDADQVYTVPIGFHDGSGTVQLSAAEVAKLKNHANIKNGVTILGETGTYSGEAVAVEANKNATPRSTQQIITPSTGYDYLAQVTVQAIPYVESSNTYGTTVTIG